jgi:hypothetical protein
MQLMLRLVGKTDTQSRQEEYAGIEASPLGFQSNQEAGFLETMDRAK